LTIGSWEFDHLVSSATEQFTLHKFMIANDSSRTSGSTLGIWSALGAYVCWGLFPIYWKFLAATPAPILLCHRVVWSCVVLLLVLAATRQLNDLRRALLQPKMLGVYALAAVLIAANWLTFVWAVNHKYIVETSLGYFINPLLNVVVGYLFFSERMRKLQWVALTLAASGVAYLTWSYGTVPWIALILASTFGLYGVVKKLAPLNALLGLSLETLILLLPAAIYLGIAANVYQQPIGSSTVNGWTLLAGTGVVTTIPLVLFAAAAQRIPLVLVGLFQYIAPSLQFLIGVLVYQEPFTAERQLGFSVVWIALFLFAAENLNYQRAKRKLNHSQVSSS
jgi:chloramphenicol-sensitive protein RarD